MPRQWVYAAVIVFVTIVGLLLAGVWYVNKVDQDAERRNVERSRDWCRIIVMLDDRNQTLPPAQDQQTADFRAALHDLRISKGC